MELFVSPRLVPFILVGITGSRISQARRQALGGEIFLGV